MFEYAIRKSDRARHLRITVKNDGSVIVTVPRGISEEAGRSFAERRREWIKRALLKVRSRPQPLFAIPKGSTRDYRKHKDGAFRLVCARLAHFNALYGLSWKNVAIKNTVSRWGSCSRKGNLNFNYRIVFLPTEYANYIIVHELCHLQEFNHSPAFWKLVEQALPDYRTYRKQLRNI